VAAGTGALVWATPAVRTVQTGTAGGSAPPRPNVSGTVVHDGAPEPPRTGTIGPTPTVTSAPKVTAAPDGARLPLTGGDVAQLAAIGATSVVAGGLMMRAQQRMQQQPPLR
jgi:hypothetical protein